MISCLVRGYCCLLYGLLCWSITWSLSPIASSYRFTVLLDRMTFCSLDWHNVMVKSILLPSYHCYQKHQSINQSNFYSGCPRRSQAQWCNSRIRVQQQNRWCSSVTSMGHQACWWLWGMANQKSCVLRCFLKVATEMAERDIQQQVVPKRQEWKGLAPLLVLTLGKDRVIHLFDLSDVARRRCR